MSEEKLITWRPKNWENPYAPADYPSGVVSAFEAGADAMLRELKKEGKFKPKGKVAEFPGIFYQQGHLCFMPLEDDKPSAVIATPFIPEEEMMNKEKWKGFECVGETIAEGIFGFGFAPIGCKCIADDICRNSRNWKWDCQEQQYTYYKEDDEQL